MFDKSRDLTTPYTYKSEDWNPSTYEEAVTAADLSTAYQASKQLAELTAWDRVRSPSGVNTSLQVHIDMVLGVASKPLATLCSSSWIDVRDLALAHIEAVYIRPETSDKQFVRVARRSRTSSERLILSRRRSRGGVRGLFHPFVLLRGLKSAWMVSSFC